MNKIISKVLDQIKTGIIVVNDNFEIVIWNEWLEALTKKASAKIIGQKINIICPVFNNKIYRDILHNALFWGQSRFCSGALHKAFILSDCDDCNDSIRQNMLIEPCYDGEQKFALIQISDVTSHLNRVHLLKNVIKDLESANETIKISQKNAEHQALHDFLTGLPNRLLLSDRLNYAISFAQRNNQKIAVLFLDLDDFKQVNDSFGHACGDRLLQAVAERLQSCVRKTDTVSRLGGDEFTIILPQIKSNEDARIIAQKISEAIQQPYEIFDQTVTIGISIGISIYPSDSHDAEALIEKADRAMYTCKRSGKFNYQFYKP